MPEVGTWILRLCRRLFISFFHLLALHNLHCSRIHPPLDHIFFVFWCCCCRCYCFLSVCVYALTQCAIFPLHLNNNCVLSVAIVFGSVLIRFDVGRGGVFHCSPATAKAGAASNSQFSRVPHHHRQHTTVLLIVVCHTLLVHKYIHRTAYTDERASQRPYSYLLLLPLIFTLNVSVVCFVPVRFVSLGAKLFNVSKWKPYSLFIDGGEICWFRAACLSITIVMNVLCWIYLWIWLCDGIHIWQAIVGAN